MVKETNCSICHFKNYIKKQKGNCVLKICFNNDKLTPWAKPHTEKV